MQLQTATWNWANITHCKTVAQECRNGASPGEICCKIFTLWICIWSYLVAHKSRARWTGKYLKGIKTAIEIEIEINNWPTPTNLQLKQWRRRPFFLIITAAQTDGPTEQTWAAAGYQNSRVNTLTTGMLWYISANKLWYISVV